VVAAGVAVGRKKDARSAAATPPDPFFMFQLLFLFFPSFNGSAGE
jgi:hypothetical protein